MSDYIVKAIAAQGMIRAYASTTRLTVEKARRRHNTSPTVTAALGRLLTAAGMMGCMMKNDTDKLTIRFAGDGPMQGMTVVADSKANVKGYALVPDAYRPANDKGKLDVGGVIGAGTLSVTRDIGFGEPFTGTCELVSGEVAEDLTYYFATSEQTPSAVALGVLMNKNNTVRAAGGIIVQLMPGIDDATIEILEQRLGAITAISSMLDAGMKPEEILTQVFEGMDLEILETVPTDFHCECTRSKTLKVIAGLDPKALNEWIEKDLPTEVVCEYCGTKYLYQADEVREAMIRYREELEKKQKEQHNEAE